MLYSTSSSCFLTNMAKWRLFFVLLLPLTVSSDSEETLVKTIGSKPDVTPICTNETQQIITLVVCKIRTQMRGEECRLLYRYGQDFIHECDSRFTLMMENQTMFLHLTSLTPEDSGNFTCECSRPDGTIFVHLNITVEDVVEHEDVRNSTLTLSVLIGVTTVTMITVVILGLIYRRIHRGKHPVPQSSPANSELQDIEPYSTFINREGGLYSIVRVNTN